jgi:hypothetical protein
MKTQKRDPFCVRNFFAGGLFRAAFTLSGFALMSALPPKADIVERNRHVRFVPEVTKVRRSGPVALGALARCPFFPITRRPRCKAAPKTPVLEA